MALLALIFGASLVVQSPEGGLSSQPFGIAERAASGMVSVEEVQQLQFAFAD